MTTETKSFEHTLQLETTACVVDERTKLKDIQKAVPSFFNTKFGKNEVYLMHRGFLIVRCTRQYTGTRPIRETSVYLYTEDLEGTGPDTFCVSAGNDSRMSGRQGLVNARKLIDKILETEQYKFGMNF